MYDETHPGWQAAVNFHGHTCPGLAYGFRVAMAALAALAAERPPDEELFAVVETDACAVDAVQVLLGCTLGKGNLIFRDCGKHVFTIGRRDTGEAVRIATRRPGWMDDPCLDSLREKARRGAATEQERLRLAESRARLEEGQPVCIPCSGGCSRGW